MRRLWVTGYRSYELNVFKEDDPKVQVIKKVLTDYLKNYLEEDEEECWLISGPQMGVERWALECGLDLKDDYPQLRLALMEPYTEFDQRWNEGNQENWQWSRAESISRRRSPTTPTSRPSNCGLTSASC